MAPVAYANPIPFNFFCDLLSNIQSVPPIPIVALPSRRASAVPPREARILKLWIEELRRRYDPLPAETGVIFFRLLFPEEGVRRRYGMKEQMLCTRLETYFHKKKGAFDGYCVDDLERRTISPGNLGSEVMRVLGDDYRPRRDSQLTLGRVEELLDQLASSCKFSSTALRTRKKGRSDSMSVASLLKELLDPLSAPRIALVIQIILRDLSPLLYAHPSSTGSASLLRYNTNAYNRIELWQAMRAWHDQMPRLYRVTADLDVVARELEKACWNGHGIARGSFMPTVGVPIQVPKSLRPGTCAVATRGLKGEVAVETKYDGERLQIHIDMSLPRAQQITIFSKSGRNSTQTRHLLLPIIRAALSLNFSRSDALLDSRLASRLATSPQSKLSATRYILEGEMVPFNEEEDRIDEFWKLATVKHNIVPTGVVANSQDSVETGFTGGDGSAEVEAGLDRLHLMIVWFDVLLLDGETLLDDPYESRQHRLSCLIRPIHGFSVLTERTIINFDYPCALRKLRQRFAEVITDRGEGLMLKRLNSPYNDPRLKWVKLKKDFIPGAGDTKDFNVVGASWQMARGRELGVPPSVFTTFFVGLLAPHLKSESRIQRDRKPHYHILFTSSYGLDRARLDDLNLLLRQDSPEPFETDSTDLRTTFAELPASRGRFKCYSSPCTTFTFSLADHLVTRPEQPRYIFKEPKVFEMNGAGFQKSFSSPYYELRWPRITKVNRTDASPLGLDQLQLTALAAMQTTSNSAAGQIHQIWTTRSPATQSPCSETREQQHRRETKEWVRKLEIADKVALKDSVCSPVLPRRTASAPALQPSPSPATLRARIASMANVGTTGELLPALPVNINTSSDTPSPRSIAVKKVYLWVDSLDSSPAHSTSTLPTSPFKGSPIRRTESSPVFVTRKRKITTPSPPGRCSSGPLHAGEPSELKTVQSTKKKRIVRLSYLPPTRLSTRVDEYARMTTSFWSVYPPTCASSIPTSRHPDLTSDNYLLDPASVLWAAGWEIDDGRPAFIGTPKLGWIFIDGQESLNSLSKLGTKGEKGQMVVVCLRKGGMENAGMFNWEEYAVALW